RQPGRCRPWPPPRRCRVGFGARVWFFLSSLTVGRGPPARAAIGSSGPGPGPYTHQGRAARRERRGPGVKLTAGGAGSAEGVSAGAGAARVRVVDREALLLDRVG